MKEDEKNVHISKKCKLIEIRFSLLPLQFRVDFNFFISRVSFFLKRVSDRPVDPIFVGKEMLNAISALENNPKINAVQKYRNAGFQLFGKKLTLYP